MIDTHCHLTDPRLLSQLSQVLERALAAGVSRIITIGTDLEDDRQALAVCKSRENIWCAVGVHPNHVAQVEPSDLPQIKEIQADSKVIALGEMGLDYHYGTESRNRQIEFFEYQLDLATAVNKPVVIHSRESIDDCLAVLQKFPGVRGIFHCFTGTTAEATKVLDAGYWLGFTGVVTFKNADEIREAVKLCPLDRMLVETDAPYLSPEPMRKQKVNEPALVMYTAATVAQVRGVTLQQLEELTTNNAERFFGLPKG